MSNLRPPIARVLAELLAASEADKEVSLDRIGEAIGAMAITPDEIDGLMKALEAEGRRITSPEGGGGEERLRQVLVSARALGPELGRKHVPTLTSLPNPKPGPKKYAVDGVA